MVIRSKFWDALVRFCTRAEARLTEANSNTTEAMYSVFGTTTIVALDAFTFSSSIAALAVYVSRSWQSSGTANLNGLQFLVRSVFTLLIASGWVHVLRRWFGYLSWPRWWAFPYVLVVLCPWAWVFAYRLGMGGDFICLFLLQLPVTLTYVWRAHTRGKELRGRR